MSNVDLKICMGTTCYVMGGAELREVTEVLPPEVRSRVTVSYSPCLGMCGTQGEPPYVSINGRIVARVSRASLVQLLKEELR